MNTVLLVIDLQVDLVAQCYEPEALLGQVRQLVAQARSNRIPVIFIQDDDVGDGADSPGWQLHPAIIPLAQETVIRKPGSDSFYRTDLEQRLRRLGIQQLVVCGLNTEACVDSTCRRAIALGYKVTLVADGHSTSNTVVMSPAQTIAYHNALLDGFGLEDGFGNSERWITVAPAAEIRFAEVASHA